MKLIIVTALVGNLIGTAYRSVPDQTDSSPNFTATGEKTCGHGIAVSGDLLKKAGGPLDYGDVVYIEGIGIKVINDTMNKRHKGRFDVWVSTYKEEKAFDQKYRNKKFKVWLLKTTEEQEVLKFKLSILDMRKEKK